MSVSLVLWGYGLACVQRSAHDNVEHHHDLIARDCAGRSRLCAGGISFVATGDEGACILRIVEIKRSADSI